MSPKQCTFLAIMNAQQSSRSKLSKIENKTRPNLHRLTYASYMTFKTKFSIDLFMQYGTLGCWMAPQTRKLISFWSLYASR